MPKPQVRYKYFLSPSSRLLQKGLCTKDVHPNGGRGGFEIVDENGHGGGGVLTEWMSTFPDFSKYNCEQNLKHLKNQSGAVTIYIRVVRAV